MNRAFRLEAAVAYCAVFLSTIAWLHIRFDSWTPGFAVLLPYSLLLVAAAGSGASFGGLLAGDSTSPGYLARLLFVPLLVAASAMLATSTTWLLIGWTLSGKVSLSQLDFIVGLPLFFVRETWLPLLAGLAAATCYLDVIRRRAPHP